MSGDTDNIKGAYLERTIPIPTYSRNAAVDKQRDLRVVNILMKVWSKTWLSGPLLHMAYPSSQVRIPIK